MDLHQELALMTDSEVESCLNGILKGWAESEPTYAALLASPSDMKNAIEESATRVGALMENVREVTLTERPKAIRRILVSIADDPKLSPRLEAWISTARPKLLEPVTTAIVLGGILFLLSLDVDFKYEDKNGQKSIKLVVKKRATTEEVLKRFLDIFNVTRPFN